MSGRAISGRGEGRPRRSIGWRNRDVVRTTALVLAVLLAAQLFWVAHVLFFVVFLGVLFGIAVSGGVDHFQRYRVPRAVSATLIVASFVGLLIGFGAWVAPTLREQGGELRQKLPEAVDRVQEWVKQRQSGVLGLLVTETQAPAPTAAPAAPSRAGGSRATTAVVVPEPAKPASVQDQMKSGMSGLSQYLFPFITSTVEFIGALVLILFLSIYFAAEPDFYRRGLLSLLPAKKRARGVIMMDRVAVVLRKWLLTQLIAMAVIGAVSTIALLVLDIKAAFALGVLAGLFEFIPTVGPILSALPAIAMGFLDSPEKAATVAFTYWGLQFLESHILIPLLMKEGLRLPPALTVVTQALMTIVFGFIGLMVAVPLLATIMVMVQMFYLEQLPMEGTWTYPAFTPDLDEPIEGSHVSHG
ncbi:MAG: AI-2E family transporter [bacterium]